jgi:ubiquinone/menaquinone biosynthesis C-methylase UbiE
MAAPAKFWDRIANRYAARPIKDTATYEAMLADAAGRLTSTDRVLEIGCGTGSISIRLAPHAGSWTATDFSAEMLRIARAKTAPENLSFVLADAGDAFEGEPFDAICAFQVLHLVDDLPGLLSRIHAQLKPGGLLIAKTWCFADMGLRLRGLFLVLRVVGLFPPAKALTKTALRQAIGEASFEIEDERVFGQNPHGPYIVARKQPGLNHPSGALVETAPSSIALNGSTTPGVLRLTIQHQLARSGFGSRSNSWMLASTIRYPTLPKSFCRPSFRIMVGLPLTPSVSASL